MLESHCMSRRFQNLVVNFCGGQDIYNHFSLNFTLNSTMAFTLFCEFYLILHHLTYHLYGWITKHWHWMGFKSMLQIFIGPLRRVHLRRKKQIEMSTHITVSLCLMKYPVHFVHAAYSVNTKTRAYRYTKAP